MANDKIVIEKDREHNNYQVFHQIEINKGTEINLNSKTIEVTGGYGNIPLVTFGEPHKIEVDGKEYEVGNVRFVKRED